jgi:N-carbamoylputrescine amidase
VLTATLDLSRAATHRAGMGFFRDRRPNLYGRLAQDI